MIPALCVSNFHSVLILSPSLSLSSDSQFYLLSSSLLGYVTEAETSKIF